MTVSLTRTSASHPAPAGRHAVTAPFRTTPRSGWAPATARSGSNSGHEAGAAPGGSHAIDRHKAKVADQLGGAPGRRAQHHLIGRPDLQQLAAVQDREPVRERLRVGQFVRDQHGRHVARDHQRDHQVSQGAAQVRVQAGVGLVEEQRVAAGEQQAAESDSVRLPSGQPGRHHRQQLADPEHPGQLGQLPRFGRDGRTPGWRVRTGAGTSRDPGAAARPGAATAAPRPAAARWTSAPGRRAPLGRAAVRRGPR